MMVSMKTDDSGVEPYKESEYGYGLCLYLNDDQVEALGIKQPLRAGIQVKLAALAVVKSVTESTEMDGDDKGNDISLSLQITDMELSGVSNNSEMAKTLYGTDNS